MIDLIDITKKDAPTAPAGAPAPAGVPAAPVAPGGVVGKALALASGVDAAADARLARDPIIPRILDQVGKLEGDYSAALPAIQARSAQINSLVEQEDGARPSVPRLTPLPAAPTLEEVATQRGVKPEDFNNPMRVFGQFMPVLVALGAGLLAKNGVAAINAATAAMNAAEAKDKDAWQQAHKDWLAETKATVDGNNQLVAEYKMALEDRNASMSERLAKVSALAAANKDALTQAALRGGYIDQLQSLLDMRTNATKPIENMLALTMEDERQRDALELRRAAQAAELYFKANPPLTSQDEMKAHLARKVMMGSPLTPEEEASKKMLMEFAERGGMQGWNYGAPPAPAGAAAPVPAQPAPAAAPATDAPPASMLKEGVRTTFKNGQVWTLVGGKPKRLN